MSAFGDLMERMSNGLRDSTPFICESLWIWVSSVIRKSLSWGKAGLTKLMCLHVITQADTQKLEWRETHHLCQTTEVGTKWGQRCLRDANRSQILTVSLVPREKYFIKNWRKKRHLTIIHLKMNVGYFTDFKSLQNCCKLGCCGHLFNNCLLNCLRGHKSDPEHKVRGN